MSISAGDGAIIGEAVEIGVDTAEKVAAVHYSGDSTDSKTAPAHESGTFKKYHRLDPFSPDREENQQEY